MPPSSFSCRFFSDGFFDYPRPLLGIETPGEPVQLPYRTLLLEAGGKRILVDTGGGPLSPTCGFLHQNLAAAAIRPESVDTVFLTHAHPDHVGGLLLADGSPAFPHAEIWLSWREWEYWKRLSHDGVLCSGRVFGVPALEQVTEQWLQRYLFPQEQRSLRLIDDEAEVAPGIRAFACPGHTPGHMALDVAGEFVYAADLVYRQDQITNPDITTLFDWDREVLATTRRQLFRRCQQQARRLVCCHLPASDAPCV